MEVLFSLLGMAMGSFLNCFAYRYCHKQPFVKARSKCDHCGHQLKALDMLPVFSFILLGGKCRYCGSKLSYRYLISELFGGFIYLWIFNIYGFSLKALEYLILGTISLGISCCDLEDFLIPDCLVALGLANRLIFGCLNKNFNEVLLGFFKGLEIALPILIIVLVYGKLSKKEVMGGGDIKLLFMLGCYSSLINSLLSLIVACIIGLGFGYSYTRGQNDKIFPFGPCICMGYLIVFCLNYGQFY